MYHAHYGNFRAGGFTSRLPRADPQACVPMNTLKKNKYEQITHIECLLEDAIRDEEEAIKKYASILTELESFGQYKETIEIITHIRSQETAHKALLERLLKRR